MILPTQQTVKHVADGTAIGVAISHFLGFWKDNVGTIAATLGLIWIGIQMYYFLKDKWTKK